MIATMFMSWHAWSGVALNHRFAKKKSIIEEITNLDFFSCRALCLGVNSADFRGVHSTTGMGRPWEDIGNATLGREPQNCPRIGFPWLHHALP